MKNRNDGQAGFMKKIKSWDSKFFAYKKFSLPKGDESILERITSNLNYFGANYTLIGTIILFFGTLTQLSLFFLVVLSIIMWIVLLKKPELFDLVKVNISTSSQYLIVMVANFIIICYFAGHQIFTIIGVSSAIILIHALLSPTQTQILPTDYSNLQSSETQNLDHHEKEGFPIEEINIISSQPSI